MKVKSETEVAQSCPAWYTKKGPRECQVAKIRLTKDVIKKLQNAKRIQEISRTEKHLPPTQDGGLEEQLAFCHGREQKPRVSQTSKFWRKPSPTETPHPAKPSALSSVETPRGAPQTPGSAFPLCCFSALFVCSLFPEVESVRKRYCPAPFSESPEDAYF